MRRILALIVMTGILVVGVFASAAVAQETDTPTIETGGTVVTRPEVGGARASLPFTGSTGTGTYVLIGLAVVALGSVLVVAGRRREHVLNRS